MNTIKKFRSLSVGALAAAMLLMFGNPAQAQIETGENLMNSASQFGQIQYFRTLLEETGLDDELNDDGPFTIFAPTDQAFQDMPAADLEELLANPDELRNVLRAHISEGMLLSEDLGTTEEIETVQGVVFEVNHHEAGISVSDALLVAADIIATNGAIHAVDKVLLP